MILPDGPVGGSVASVVVGSGVVVVVVVVDVVVVLVVVVLVVVLVVVVSGMASGSKSISLQSCIAQQLWTLENRYIA